MNLKSLPAISFAIALSVSALIHASPAAAAEVPIPATTEAILEAIDAKSAELKQVIDARALPKVRHLAFAIRDLVAALPSKSASLPPEKLARVRRDAKFVSILADRLNATGDASDQSGTQSNYTKLSTVLASIHDSCTSSAPRTSQADITGR